MPVVVAFACVAMASHDPLAALQLSLEWGHAVSYTHLTLPTSDLV